MSGLGRAFAQAQERFDDALPSSFFDDDSDDEISAMRMAIKEAEALIGRAERALDARQIDAASDLLAEAGKFLSDGKDES